MTALKMAKGADGCAGFNSNARAKHHVLFNHRITADIGVKAEINRIGGKHRNTVFQGLDAFSVLKQRLGTGQFRTGVNAHRFGLVTFYGTGFMALGARRGDNIGQVIFTTGIVIADAGK